MPHRYCFDTSGLSNPRETLPEDIYTSVWNFVRDTIASGSIAVTREVLDEMRHIGDALGDFIGENEKIMLLEIGGEGWNGPVTFNTSPR